MTVTDTPTLRWETVALTGHRPKYLTRSQRGWVKYHLGRAAVWLRDQRGTRVGISGMAAGSDLWWADAVVAAGLTLAVHIPCPQQTGAWRDQDTIAAWERLYALRDPALSKVIADRYSNKALFARNLSMLRAADAVVAVWLPGQFRGGTHDAVCQAVAMGKPGIWLDPGGNDGAGKVHFALPTAAQLSRPDPHPAPALFPDLAER